MDAAGAGGWDEDERVFACRGSDLRDWRVGEALSSVLAPAEREELSSRLLPVGDPNDLECLRLLEGVAEDGEGGEESRAWSLSLSLSLSLAVSRTRGGGGGGGEG